MLTLLCLNGNSYHLQLNRQLSLDSLRTPSQRTPVLFFVSIFDLLLQVVARQMRLHSSSCTGLIKRIEEADIDTQAVSLETVCSDCELPQLSKVWRACAGE